MKRTIKRLSVTILAIMVVVIQKTRQLYKDIKEHSDKVVTLAGNEQRVQNAPSQNKFFISFWVRFKTKTYIRRASTKDKFVASVVPATDFCTLMDPDSWVFYVVPYSIEKTSSTSFKLHPLREHRQEVPLPQDCQTNLNPLCVCPGRPFQDLDPVLSDSIVVVPSGGAHQFSLATFDGTSGKPEVRNTVSGLVTLTSDNLVSHQVMAELMKGQNSNIFEIDYRNLNFNVITPYLGKFTQNKAYK